MTCKLVHILIVFKISWQFQLGEAALFLFCEALYLVLLRIAIVVYHLPGTPAPDLGS